MAVIELAGTQMAFPHQCVRVVAPHEAIGDTPEYHEWVNLGERVRADHRGHRNPRMSFAAWARWICNNTDCHASALVHDDLVRLALNNAAVTS